MRPDRVPVFYCDNSPLIIFSSLCTVAIKRNGFLLLRNGRFSAHYECSLSEQFPLLFFFFFFTHSNFRKAYRIWLAGLKHKADKVLLLKVCLAFESSYSYSQSHVCSFILRSRLEPIDIPKLIQFTLPQFSDFFIHQWPWGCTNEDKCIIQKKREILGIYIYIVVACFFWMLICGCLVIFYEKKLCELTLFNRITARKLWLAFKWMKNIYFFTTFIYLSYSLPFKSLGSVRIFGVSKNLFCIWIYCKL